MRQEDLDAVLKTPETSLSPDIINAYLSEFEADAAGECEYPESFDAFRRTVMMYGRGDAYSERFHLCAQAYIAALSLPGVKRRDALAAVCTNEVGYYAMQNAQASCIHYAHLLLSLDNVPDDSLCRVLGLAIDSFIKIGMLHEAKEYIEKLEERVNKGTLRPTETFTMRVNLMYAYAFIGDGDTSERYYAMLKEAKADEIPPLISYFRDLYHLTCMALTDPDNQAFYNEFERLIVDNDTLTENSDIFLFDESFLLLPIFKRAWQHFGEQALLSCIGKFLVPSNSAHERIAFYAWFFDEMGASPKRYLKEYADYVADMKLACKLNMQNQRHRVADELMRQELDERYRRQATVDALTKINNRFAYEKDMQKLRDDEMPQKLAILMADLNGLKATNDRYGHDVGDELLRGAVDCLEKAFGKYGKLYRIGGDEFVGIMMAEKADFENAENELRKLTASFCADSRLTGKLDIALGWALRSELASDAKVWTLVRRAEKRMYADKERYYSNPAHERRKK